MDQLNITILQDGTIKVETDKISMVNHFTAEAFLHTLTIGAGGPQERKHKFGSVAAPNQTHERYYDHGHSHDQ